MTRCPFCAEDIQDAAIVCKHCRRDIPATPNPPPVPNLTIHNVRNSGRSPSLPPVVVAVLIALTLETAPGANQATPDAFVATIQSMKSSIVNPCAARC